MKKQGWIDGTMFTVSAIAHKRINLTHLINGLSGSTRAILSDLFAKISGDYWSNLSGLWSNERGCKTLSGLSNLAGQGRDTD
ncbi:hypothetical protein IAP91_14025 [Leuconostoc mesenteroides]|nr:hypothetical protein [Leuconostoc mesenteroides]